MYNVVKCISPEKARLLYYEIARYHSETEWTYPSFDFEKNIQNSINRFIAGLPFSPIDLLKGVKDFFNDVFKNLIKPAIDAITNFIKPIFQPIIDAFGSFFEGIKAGVKAIVQPFFDAVNWAISGITNFISSIWDAIRNLPNTITSFIAEAYKTLQSWFQTALETAVSGMKWIWEGISSGVEYLKGQLQQFWNTVINHLSAIGNVFAEGFNWLIQGLKDALGALGKFITDGLKTAWEGLMSGFRSIAEGLSDAWNGVMDGISGFAGSIKEIVSFSGSGYDHEKAYSTIWEKMSFGIPIITSGQVAVTVVDAFQLLSNMHIKDTYQYVLEISGVRAWMQTVFSTEFEVNTAIPQRLRLLYTIMPNPMDLRDAKDMRSRFIISDADLYEALRFNGINPTTELKAPTKWYSERSILENPMDSTKWKSEDTETYMDAYVRQAGSPAGYFLLAMASRSGFFEEKLFMKALLDSNYGALAMGIAMSAFKRNFLSRWITKYEDEAVTEFIAGDIEVPEFRERLGSLGYDEALQDMYVDFFESRKALQRRKATLTLVKAAYKAGRFDVEVFKRELQKIGYRPAVIEMIIDQTHAEIAPDRELTKSEILRMYKTGLLNKNQTTMRLNNIYADSKDVDLLIRLYSPEAKEAT